MGFFEILTIINSILLAVLPLAFFRRQKLQEIRYTELMELNRKTHDITNKIDKSLSETRKIVNTEYERLKFLETRYKKHSPTLSKKISEYKKLWDDAIQKNRKGESSEDYSILVEEKLLKMSSEIRDFSDKLLK